MNGTSPTLKAGTSGPGTSPPELALTHRKKPAQLADRHTKGTERHQTGGSHRTQEDKEIPGWRQLSQQLLVTRALGEAEAKKALEQVTQERDDAIAKKLAVEAELGICRARLQAVEEQLLEVVKEKLMLMEEVEAWKDDMQELVSRQIRSQMQREGSDPWRGRVPASGSRTQPGLTTHVSQWQWRWRRRGSGLKQMESWPPSQEGMASSFASEI
ncbi:uncharacterized protein LOC118858152 [Trichosurus vulpecula]|uniref:uncharacterized protein LOC118858152 n=1 Tax=Trichosurus vulpecula TaxID=9337 RepID=UPI00186B345A|nr:uncharacterized protein LOC118858152 [Trichosurus vulpecula]